MVIDMVHKKGYLIQISEKYALFIEKMINNQTILKYGQNPQPHSNFAFVVYKPDT